VTHRANARDEWRAAALASSNNFVTASTALAVARARCNHAAAEGASYA